MISSSKFTGIITIVLNLYVVLAMANKKLLICAALAAGLLLTACVKKEEPKNEDQQEQESSETQTAQQPEPEKAQEFESLESVNQTETTPPVIETSREETANTTTEIRRETRPAEQTYSNTNVESTPPAEPKKPVQTEPKPVKAEQPKSSTPAQSEDDAVAAAIAAATPALNN